VTACTTCGDDVIEPTEQCEGTDLAGESCESLGLYPGVLGCNPTVCNFDVSGCGPYFEDFELGVLPFEYTIGGDLGWVIDNSSAYSGVHAAHNGPITDGQTSWIELQGNFVVEGELSFRHRESTESGVDFLRLYIDGAEVGSWSGTNGWNESSFPVSAGAHVFQWRYEKDNSVSAGEDRVWIDDVYLLVGSAI